MALKPLKDRLKTASKKGSGKGSVDMQKWLQDKKDRVAAYKKEKELRLKKEETVKRFSDFRERIVEEVIEESTRDLPMTIMLIRKGIRIFPTGDRVALYTNSKLGVDVSIPYGERLHNPMKGYGKLTKAIGEEYEELDEAYSMMKRLEDIANGDEAVKVPMANGSVAEVHPVTAKYILSLHDVLTPENQKLVRSMMNSSPADFAKIAKFAQETASKVGGAN